ncbi:MAG: zinc ABC transporter substrate-binding protein [Bifidobacteriaceae bacterium]|nr:zinc ABC transporter substrate-binding protein [Bifidobacteriaceae bacterium]
MKYIKRFIAAITSLVMLSVVCACSQTNNNSSTTTTESPTYSAPLKVVATINQWGSLAQEIGGSLVSVTSIMTNTNVEAHDYEPQASDVSKLEKADVVVINGAGYDAWATKNISNETLKVSAASIVGAATGDNPHLWFSKDARAAVAKELANTFSKALPKKKQTFEKNLKAWEKTEATLDESIQEIRSKHKNISYAATESIAYYLMSDLGFTNVTPKGYEQAVASEAETSASDLQDFTTLLEARKANILINNAQETSDATNTITGVAHRSDIPVVDLTEQMPSEYKTVNDWISAIIKSISDALDANQNSNTDSDNQSDNSSQDSESQIPSNEGQTDPGK